jgi:hypothetical protein
VFFIVKDVLNRLHLVCDLDLLHHMLVADTILNLISRGTICLNSPLSQTLQTNFTLVHELHTLDSLKDVILQSFSDSRVTSQMYT